MKTRIKFAVILIVMLTLVSVLFGPHTVYPADNPDQEQIAGIGWYITGNREKRSKYHQVDGTADMFFICYFNGYVDAYTNDGEYQFTYVIHSSSQNGGASIMCTPDLIYIHYKDSDILAFRGTELVERMSYSEFREMGYYMKPSGAVYIAKDGVYRRDEGGAAHYQCALPEEIEKVFPLISFSANVEKTIMIVLIAVLFVLFTYVIFIRPILWKRKGQ